VSPPPIPFFSPGRRQLCCFLGDTPPPSSAIFHTSLAGRRFFPLGLAGRRSNRTCPSPSILILLARSSFIPPPPGLHPGLGLFLTRSTVFHAYTALPTRVACFLYTRSSPRVFPSSRRGQLFHPPCQINVPVVPSYGRPSLLHPALALAFLVCFSPTTSQWCLLRQHHWALLVLYFGLGQSSPFPVTEAGRTSLCLVIGTHAAFPLFNLVARGDHLCNTYALSRS